ncbi:hypothetical protein FAZ95_03045 [Trinickia violacea]|uniref:Uncharacterized protein n=1 Tax=Trinickia violacea TaxID=2571746 RepID=A0A4P8IHW8_9BURK|nr:BPSL0761 family protein [Trinickia violacea]QCP48258.1 hypothetical protein FAZ95_03045 [Trinickia violacea]
MTVPYERTQAVLRSRDLLRKLAAGEHIDADTLRRRASSLLRHFPTPIDIAVSADALPSVWAAVDAKWYE